MSGFDFDALRDPVPPEPGARERAAVDARARKLRARSRLNRLAVSSVSVVAVVALVFGIAASQRNNDGGRLDVQGGGGTSTTRPAPTTTTTTPPVVTHSAPAVSATFVSPDHGWLLERNGTVTETTDGGATWSRVGTIGSTGEQIRFANATDGYELDRSGIMTTVDGGAHWERMIEPFGGNPFDLAVAHNTVYVAAGNAQAGVDVWTTPVGSTNWTAASTGVSIGAGPIPDSQLVFAGPRAWLLQVDRTVVGGAQLTPSGTWTTWTPPCANAGGAAFLAASTPSDLVGSCEEGVYTGPSVTHGIYFSHDGGQTFTRHTAPESGLVATPNATTAIVTGSAGVQRTTDGGVTWHSVFNTPSGAVDLGFTTTTQGFIVFSNGDMLMTHDAGATWQKVTL